jgi:hypothetical protein
MIHIKEGVEFTVIALAGFQILLALKQTSKTLGIDLTITSACEGEHSGPNDPHKLGEAYDVRSHDLVEKQLVLNQILLELNKDQFFGFLETKNTSNEHFHIQRKRGILFTIEDFLNA